MELHPDYVSTPPYLLHLLPSISSGPKILTSTAPNSNLINALWATFGILFTLNAAWTADRFGRRWLFIVGAIGMSVCMLIVPVIGMATPDVDGVKSQPVAIGIVFMLFAFM